MIKVGIVGYGNLGKGVCYAVEKASDLECVGIFTRRAPEQLNPVVNFPVYSINDLIKFKGKIDRVLSGIGGRAVAQQLYYGKDGVCGSTWRCRGYPRQFRRGYPGYQNDRFTTHNRTYQKG